MLRRLLKQPFAMVQKLLRLVFSGSAGSYMVALFATATLVYDLAWFGAACLKWTKKCIVFTSKLAPTLIYLLGGVLCIMEIHLFFYNIYQNGCPQAHCIMQFVPNSIFDSSATSSVKKGVYCPHPGL